MTFHEMQIYIVESLEAFSVVVRIRENPMQITEMVEDHATEH